EILRVPRHHVARRVAHRAADALDAGIRLHARRRIRAHFREIVLARGMAAELAFGARPLVEELAHVRHQVANDRQIAQRSNRQFILLSNLVDMRPAGPARHAVHHHRARAAHADPAGEAIGERRIERALDVGNDVEHGLARLARHVEALEGAVGAAPPDRNLQIPSHSSPPMISVARNSVSDTSRITGCQPSAASSAKEVITPSAAIAATRHQRESEASASPACGGTQPALFAAASSTNTTRNQGSSGVPRPFFLLWKKMESAITTGTSSATRSSLTKVAVTPASGEIM